MKSRVKLFDAVVTPRVLYACSTWSLTETDERLLRSTRRRMIRQIAGGRRRVYENAVVEEWVDWVQRATHKAESIFESNTSECWIRMHRRRKWRFALNIARATDGRWTKKLHKAATKLYLFLCIGLKVLRQI